MRGGGVIAALVFGALPAGAGERPGLDDFYERTRSRAEGFERCAGYCRDGVLLQALVGAQVANPSTDVLRPALAEGVRLGGDAGLLFGPANIVRTRAWADLLRVQDTGDFIADLVSQSTLFVSTAEPGGLGVHLSADVVLADRTELEPEDFAELQRTPYRLVDVEAEVAPVGPEVDKDAFIALPIGYAQRVRWDGDGELEELRRTWSGGPALRGFPKQLRHHYQLDVGRVTRVDWETPAGEASAWQVSAGYQRLSPDIDFLQIWLLFGWGWYDGHNEANGFLARVGCELDLGEHHQVGPMYDAELVLDRRTLRFRRAHHFRGYYRTTAIDHLRLGLLYEAVAVTGEGTLHALTPEVAVRPFENLGLEFGVRYRAAFLHDLGGEGAPDADRFNFSADWLF